MKRAVWSFGLVALLLAACSDNGSQKDNGPGEPDPSMTLVELVRAEGVPANGSDAAIIRVVARDENGRPVPNRLVEATSSEPSDTVSVEPPRTDRDGVSVIRVTAEKVGTRVISIMVNSLVVPQRPTVEFVPGTGDYLEFVEVPTVGKAGHPLRPAIRVEAKDVKGNRVMDFDGEVSLHVGTSATYTERAVQGVATFADVVITEPGEHHVRATAPGLKEAQSGKIDIFVGDPAYLTFQKQPQNVKAGEPFSVSVTIRDPGGNIVVGANDIVYLRLYSNPTGATLEGPVAVQAQNGEATFDNLVINRPSAGYQLTAAVPGYRSAESDVFTVYEIDPVEQSSYLKIRPEGAKDPNAEPVAVANGRQRLRIEAKLLDDKGNPLANHPVTLTATGTGHRFHPAEPAGAETLETLTTAAGTVLAWISSTVAETKTVTLRVGELFELNATATFVADTVMPTYSELVPSAVTAIADLEDFIRFDVVAKDAQGNPIANQVANVTVSGTGNAIEGLTGSSVITGPNGVGTFYLRSSKAERKTVVVRMDDVVFSHDVEFYPGAPDRSMSLVVPVSPTRVATVGTQIGQPFEVIVRDKFGNPIPNQQVHFEFLGVYPDLNPNSQPLQVNQPIAALVPVGGLPTGTTADVVTDENGVAAISLIVEKKSGLNRVAWDAGWNGTPRADLEAIGQPGEADRLVAEELPNPMTAVAGQSLSPIKIRALDAYDNYTGGLALDFAPSGPNGPGSVSPANPVLLPAWEFPNRQQPTAQVTWTLDTVAGPNTLTVTTTTSPSGRTLTVQVGAQGTAGAPSRMQIVNGTSNFQAVVTNALLEAFTVNVYDTNNNLVSDGYAARFRIGNFTSTQKDGEFVEFPAGSVVAPNGEYVDVPIVGGQAWARYKLGEKAGQRAITVEVVNFTSVKATFNVVANPDAPAQMQISAGDGQTAKVGKRVANALAVRIADQYDNPVSGVTVHFQVTAGAGPNATLGPDGQEGSSYDPKTDANGIARAPFRVGDRPGTYQVTASVGSMSEVFTATAILGDPAQLEIAGGNGQSGTVDQDLDEPLQVRVMDDKNNLLPNVQVSFSAPNMQLSATSATTNSSGIAEVMVVKLPQQAGPAQVVASVTVPSGPTLTATFNLTATPDVADSLEVLAGAYYMVEPGEVVQLGVRVKDKFGNASPGQTINFLTSPASAGTFSQGGGAPGANPTSFQSNASGEIWVNWHLPNTPGFYTARAAIPGKPVGSWANFQADVVLGAPANIVVVQGQGASAQVEGSIAVQVRVFDRGGNVVAAGTEVSFTLAPGAHDAAISSADPQTDANGYASATVAVGTVATTLNLTVTAGSVSEIVVLHVLPGPADDIELVSGDGQSGFVGLELADELVVRVVDQYGNAVEGAAVVFASAGGTPNPSNTLTDASGLASTRFTPAQAGPIAVTASIDVSGTLEQVTFDVTGLEPPASIEAVAGNHQRINPGEPFANPVVVRVLDANSDPVEGAAVNFAVTGGSIVSADEETDAEGYAAAYVQADSLEGAVTVTVSVAGFSIPGVTFDLIAEESLLCQAVGAATYYLDANGDLVVQTWTGGEGTFRMANDDVNNVSAWVSFEEAVAGEPAFGYVHPSLVLDCDGTDVAVTATASGAELSVDGVAADWTDTPPTGVSWSYSTTTGFFEVACTAVPGVKLSAYDDGLAYFTRVLAEGGADDALCSNPPVVVAQTP